MTNKNLWRISALFTVLAALALAFASCSSPLDTSLEEGHGQSRSVGNTLPRQDIDIENSDDFEKFVARVLATPGGNVSAVLLNDVDLTGVAFAPIGVDPTTGNVVTAYTGDFDGDGYTLSGINITRGNNFVGLFAINNGTIHDLRVTGSVTANYSGPADDIDYVGGVVAYNDINGHIENVVSEVSVGFTGDDDAADHIHNIGGIAGFNGWDSYNAGSPHYGQTYQPGGDIFQCRNEGSVSGGFNKVGGIVGENAYNVKECSNYGEITVTKTTTGWIGAGGIVGRNGNNNTATEYGTILNCYNRAQIYDKASMSTGHDAYGGITGWCNNLSYVANCYDTGDFDPGIGQKNPIIGRVDTSQGKGINNYSLDTVFASSTDVVLTGIRRTEAQMKAPSFVTELDLDGVYTAVTGEYPILTWELANPPPLR
ncbi:MAG: hypothetical protein LBD55_11580 [Treponema sp.]|nr:hypothetical protein [Treponema sp.]